VHKSTKAAHCKTNVSNVMFTFTIKDELENGGKKDEHMHQRMCLKEAAEKSKTCEQSQHTA